MPTNSNTLIALIAFVETQEHKIADNRPEIISTEDLVKFGRLVYGELAYIENELSKMN